MLKAKELKVKELLQDLDLGIFKEKLLCKGGIIENVLIGTECDLYYIVDELNDSYDDFKNKEQAIKWASQNINAIVEYYDIVKDGTDDFYDVINMVCYNKRRDDIFDIMNNIVLAIMFSYTLNNLQMDIIDNEMYRDFKEQATDISMECSTRLVEICQHVDTWFDIDEYNVNIYLDDLALGEYGKYIKTYDKGEINDIFYSIANNYITQLDVDDLKRYLIDNLTKVETFIVEYSDSYFHLLDVTKQVLQDTILDSLYDNICDILHYKMILWYINKKGVNTLKTTENKAIKNIIANVNLDGITLEQLYNKIEIALL